MNRASWMAVPRGQTPWALAVCFGIALVGSAVTLAEPPGDADGNQVVDLRDLIAIRNAFGQTGPGGFNDADVNGDGVVDQADLLLWRQNFPSVGSPLDPLLFIQFPLDGTQIGDRRPVILVDYRPVGLPIDVNSITARLNGADYSASLLRGFTGAALPIETALPDGPHTVEITVADILGNAVSASSTFTVSGLTLLPTATPRTGPAPLTVTFRPDVVWADSAPAWYSWDWNNDGTYEIVDPRPDLREFTFLEEGLHTIRFRVQLSDNSLATTTLTVAVTETHATVSPSNGRAPLTVFLHGIAANLDDPIVLYEWDYDYNGVVFTPDFTSTTQPNTLRVYALPGIYRPRFRATHLSGAVIEHPIVQQELLVTGAGAPTAIASAVQSALPLTVNFVGTGSDADGTIVLYEWDFESDGAWDYASAVTGATTRTFDTAGRRVATLRVTDNSGLQAVDRVAHETYAPGALELLSDTLIPANGETVTVRTLLTTPATVWLYIRAPDVVRPGGLVERGRVIRTLVDHVLRAPGTYDDPWNGLDDEFEVARPGAYYAVLEYSYPGRTDTLDYANTTGGNHSFAAKLPPDVTVFDPLANNPLPMRFRITRSSRAALYILPGGTNRTATIFDNLPLGAGDYLYYWSGLTSDGNFAPASTYLWTVNLWTLGDNAVVVRGQPAIQTVFITPTRLSPTDRPLGLAVAEVLYELNAPASVAVDIIRMDNGATLRSFRFANRPAGVNTFLWDGRTADGVYVSPGYYRLSLRAVDQAGNPSIEREGIMEIRY